MKLKNEAPMTSSSAFDINIRSDFGAVGDGIADDTASLQGAVDAASSCLVNGVYGARIVLPPGLYKYTDTLRLYRPDNAFISLGIAGASTLSSRLLFMPAVGKPAIKASGLKDFSLRDFSLSQGNQCADVDGLKMGYNTGQGTGTNDGVIENVAIDSFKGIGASVGEGTSASSEISYINLVVQNCAVAVYTGAFNSLNHTFTNLQMGGCPIGLKATAGGNINVKSGASSNCGTDFQISSSSIYEIACFRSEGATAKFLDLIGGGGRTFVSIDNCLATGNATQDLVQMYGSWRVAIRNSMIGGRILARSSGNLVNKSYLSMENTGVFDTEPFRGVTTGGANKQIGYRVAGCYQMAAAGDSAQAGIFDDEEGVVREGGVKWPLRKVRTNPANVGSVYGDQSQTLNGAILMTNLPDSDPHVVGAVWSSSGALRVSGG